MFLFAALHLLLSAPPAAAASGKSTAPVASPVKDSKKDDEDQSGCSPTKGGTTGCVSGPKEDDKEDEDDDVSSGPSPKSGDTSGCVSGPKEDDKEDDESEEEDDDFDCSPTTGCSSGSVKPPEVDDEGPGHAKVDICHWANHKYVGINVSESAVAAHLAHGDVLGGAYYPDDDGDGHGDAHASPTDCPPVGATAAITLADDCDDSDAIVSPDAVDTCGDAADNDCDGAVDELCDASCTLFTVADLDAYAAEVASYDSADLTCTLTDTADTTYGIYETGTTLTLTGEGLPADLLATATLFVEVYDLDFTMLEDADINEVTWNWELLVSDGAGGLATDPSSYGSTESVVETVVEDCNALLRDWITDQGLVCD